MAMRSVSADHRRDSGVAGGLLFRWRGDWRAGALAVVLAAMALWSVPAAAAELLYYHGPGCPYCEEWDAEVAPIYPKTDEGARLPLRRLSADATWPKELSHITRPVFTPTFVVIDDSGKEVGRIAGYQPDWFWAFLRKYIDAMDAPAREG